MAAQPTQPITLFYSYAHEDEALRKELEKHLTSLQQQGLISSWHDRMISAGAEWEYEIDDHLNRADIILLLISASFISSRYCYSIEMKRALERHEAKEARVIPIILRPVFWRNMPFGKLQVLPTDGKPVDSSSWHNHDEAFANIVEGIHTVIEELPPPQPATPKPSQPIHNIPFPRNPYFTGREDILTHLHATLSNKTAALTQPQAISGLGGIGKTQTAIAYAYRHLDKYQYIFWVRADTFETLTSDFVTIAHLLNLREKEAQEQPLTIAAVKRWLANNPDWLLILDNADDLQTAHDFLPSNGKGHILLTTRAYSTGGIAQRVEIAEMQPEQGALFLLRRAAIIGPDAPLSAASQADSSTAQAISASMDGLPLALDQAAAFIEETNCSLTDYLTIYQKQRAELLNQRGGIAAPHPDPVATTWSLSFQKVEQANPAAAEFLRLCAFLHPDAIPEEILTKGASELGPILQAVATDLIKLNKAIGELLKYSLVRRDAKAKTLTVHRLVQAVLKDEMDKETQRLWAERAVRAVNSAFPNVEYKTWPQCEQLLPQVQICAELIKQWNMTFPEIGRLLTLAGWYLRERAQYDQAEPLLQQAVALPEHPYLASILTDLAMLYHAQGKFSQAEPLFQKALTIDENVYGPEHSEIATDLNNLAMFYEAQGKNGKAEPLFQRTLAIWEKVLDPEHPNVAKILNNLAACYNNQGQYDQARPLLKRALEIREKVLGPEHPDVALTLNNLAMSYFYEDEYTKAETLYRQALAIREKVLDPEHPDVAQSLNNLASLCYNQGKYTEAEQLYQQALTIYKKALGSEHPKLALILENYAVLLEATNRKDEATKLMERAQAIRAKHAQENPPKE